MRSKADAGDRTREGGHGAATRADADADTIGWSLKIRIFDELLSQGKQIRANC